MPSQNSVPKLPETAPKPFSQLLLRLIQWAVKPLTRFLTPWTVTGRDRVPGSGGLLLLCTHRSDCDVVFLQLFYHRHITYMGKSELFEMGRLGKFLSWWQAFPVKRDTADMAAVRYAVSLLKSGRVVGIFPEGELSETGEMLPLKPGAALIARLAKVPIQCAGISGTELVLPYAKTKPQRSKGRLRLNFGDPWTPSADMSADAIMEEVRRQLTELSALPN